MHMPRNIYDLYDMDERLMDSSYDTPHYITLLPDYVLPVFQFPFRPTMFVLEDSCSTEIKHACEACEPVLGTFYTRELNEQLLKTCGWVFGRCIKQWMNQLFVILRFSTSCTMNI